MHLLIAAKGAVDFSSQVIFTVAARNVKNVKGIQQALSLPRLHEVTALLIP